MMEENYRCFKLNTGEIMLTEVEGVNDEGMYLLKYPAIVVPLTPEQAGGQPNQIGLGKFMPFSDYSKDVYLKPDAISMDTTPDRQLIEMHKQWVLQIRQKESGIIMAGANQMPKSGQAPPDFGSLNV